ncbi:MAG: hypothetical protein HZA50_07630 [Planctomycetes bacterium]|nr:hypothetical protein [Planctomycetota bacterium]
MTTTNSALFCAVSILLLMSGCAQQVSSRPSADGEPNHLQSHVPVYYSFKTPYIDNDNHFAQGTKSRTVVEKYVGSISSKEVLGKAAFYIEVEIMAIESFRLCQRLHDVELVGAGLYAFVTCYTGGSVDFRREAWAKIPFDKIQQDLLGLSFKLGFRDPQIKWTDPSVKKYVHNLNTKATK